MLNKFNLNKIPFRYKLLVIFLLIASVIVAGGSLIYVYSNNVKQQVNYVSKTIMKLNMISSEMKYVVIDVQRLISNGSLVQDEDILLKAATAAREFHNHIAEANKLVENQELIDSMEHLKKEFEAYYAEAVAMAALYIEDLTDDGEEKMKIVVELSENLNHDITEFEKSVNKMTLERINKIENRLQFIIKIVIGVVLISIAVIFLALIIMNHDLIRPIDNLKKKISQTAQCDLTIQFDNDRMDEIGTINQSMSELSRRFREVIMDIMTASDMLASSAVEMSASAAQIASSTQEQSDQSTAAATAIEQMNVTFTEVAKNSNYAAESAKEAAELAQKGGEVVTSTMQGMNRIAGAVNDSAGMILALGKSSEQIGKIVGVINEIAGQTNLLALNAAIEAARAGEQGRGFAVVADEVRKLAERTTSATNEIEQMIKTIQEDTNKAVDSMQAGTAEVNSGVKLASQAGSSLKQIVSSVQKVTDLIQHIAHATEEQTTAAQEVSTNIETVANMTMETASSIEQSNQSAQNLSALSSQLINMIHVFKIDSNGTEETSKADTVNSETPSFRTESDSLSHG